MFISDFSFLMIYWFYMHEFFLFLSATVCGNAHTEVHTCLVGLQDHLRKGNFDIKSPFLYLLSFTPLTYLLIIWFYLDLQGS